MANEITGTQIGGTEIGTQAPAPTSPAGTAATGGTPDEAKMTGTPAQKKSALDQAQKTTQKLSQASRLTQTPQLPTPDDQAAAKADRIKQLGSLGTRLQGLIEQRLQAFAQQTTAPTQLSGLAINEQALAGLAPDDPVKQAELRTALEAYQASPTQATLQTIANKLGEEGGLAYLQGGGLQGLFSSQEDVTKAGLAGLDLTQVPTIGALAGVEVEGAEALDLDQLAEDLGVDRAAVEAMTPDQLQAEVQAVVNREYSAGAGLKAEYATASPQRRQQILEELRGMGESLGIETSLASLNDQMEAGEEVEFAGQRVNITQLLEDERISEEILNAVNSEDTLEELRKTEPQLAAWIDANKSALEELQSDMRVGVREFSDVQASAEELVSKIPEGLRATFGMPEGYLTKTQLDEFKAKLEADPLYKAAAGDEALMTELTDNPELASQLKALDQASLDAALNYRGALATADDATKAALAAMGVDTSGKILTDPAAAKRALTLAETVQAYPQLRQMAGTLQELAGNEADAAKYLTKEGLEYLAKSADQVDLYDDTFKKLMNVGGSEFIRPEEGESWAAALKRAETSKADYDAALEAAKRSGYGTDALTELINDEVLTDPDQLVALKDHPEYAQQILDNKKEQEYLAAIRSLDTRPKGREAATKYHDAVQNLMKLMIPEEHLKASFGNRQIDPYSISKMSDYYTRLSANPDYTAAARNQAAEYAKLWKPLEGIFSSNAHEVADRLEALMGSGAAPAAVLKGEGGSFNPLEELKDKLRTQPPLFQKDFTAIADREAQRAVDRQTAADAKAKAAADEAARIAAAADAKRKAEAAQLRIDKTVAPGKKAAKEKRETDEFWGIK